MLAVGFVGWGAGRGFLDLIKYSVTAMNAQSDQDLNRAAEYLAKAIITIGLSTLLILLLKKPVTESAIKLKAGGISDLNLIDVGPPPASAKPTITFTSDLDPGNMGITTPYGDITVSTKISAEEMKATLLHEKCILFCRQSSDRSDNLGRTLHGVDTRSSRDQGRRTARTSTAKSSASR